MFYVEGASINVYCSSSVCLMMRTHIPFIGLHFFTMCAYMYIQLLLSRWSDTLLPNFGKQDSHHFDCHLVSRLPQVLLLHCVPLHPRWLHHCHPTCRKWHLPHSNLAPTQHHLQDWVGGCEEGWRSRRAEGKDNGKLYYWRWRWGVSVYSYSQHLWASQLRGRWGETAAIIDAVWDNFSYNKGMWV